MQLKLIQIKIKLAWYGEVGVSGKNRTRKGWPASPFTLNRKISHRDFVVVLEAM